MELSAADEAYVSDTDALIVVCRGGLPKRVLDEFRRDQAPCATIGHHRDTRKPSAYKMMSAGTIQVEVINAHSL